MTSKKSFPKITHKSDCASIKQFVFSFFVTPRGPPEEIERGREGREGGRRGEGKDINRKRREGERGKPAEGRQMNSPTSIDFNRDSFFFDFLIVFVWK